VEANKNCPPATIVSGQAAMPRAKPQYYARDSLQGERDRPFAEDIFAFSVCQACAFQWNNKSPADVL
jgi:hypothetical protein